MTLREYIQSVIAQGCCSADQYHLFCKSVSPEFMGILLFSNSDIVLHCMEILSSIICLKCNSNATIECDARGISSFLKALNEH